jgi:hypothetical protein
LTPCPCQAEAIVAAAAAGDESEAESVNGGESNSAAASIFQKGFLWSKVKLQSKVKAVSRDDFANPLAPNVFSVAVKKKLSENAERKQHFTGHQENEIWQTCLQSAIKSVALAPRHVLAILDWTPYDAELPKAIVELLSNKSLPCPACVVSVAWSGKEKHDLAKYVQKQTLNYIVSQIEADRLKCPGAPPPGSKPAASPCGATAAQLNHNLFLLAKPVSEASCTSPNGRLRLTQAFLDHWKQFEHLQGPLNDLLTERNKNFNPSGQTYRERKNTIDETLAAASDPDSDAVVLPSAGAKSDLKPQDIFIYVGSEPTYEVIVDKANAGLYLHGLDDGVLPCSAFLGGCGDGSYENGKDAEKIIQQGKGARLNACLADFKHESHSTHLVLFCLFFKVEY